jgi:hypothetical protein
MDQSNTHHLLDAMQDHVPHHIEPAQVGLYDTQTVKSCNGRDRKTLVCEVSPKQREYVPPLALCCPPPQGLLQDLSPALGEIQHLALPASALLILDDVTQALVQARARLYEFRAICPTVNSFYYSVEDERLRQWVSNAGI